MCYLPSEQLIPEIQRGSEGGLELYAGTLASLVITRYNQTVSDLLAAPKIDSVRSLIPNPTITVSPIMDTEGYGFAYRYKYLNIGSIRNQGWEIQGSINTGPLTTKGTYSWTKSRVLGIVAEYRSLLTSSAYQPGASFNFLPEHTWAVSTNYARAGGTVVLAVNGTGPLYTNGDALYFMTNYADIRLNETRPRMGLGAVGSFKSMMAGYVMTNLNASHRLAQRIDGLLQIQNLTNVYRNDYHFIYASLGRQSKMGIRWNI